MKRTLIAVIVLSVVVAGSGVVGGADDPRLEGSADGDAIVVTLSEVPSTGFSGFEVAVEATAPGVSIDSIEIPSPLGTISKTDVSDDGRSATAKASDGSDEITGGETDLSLMRISVSGGSADDLPIAITITELQDDEGAQIDPINDLDGGEEDDETDTEDDETDTEDDETTTSEDSDDETTTSQDSDDETDTEDDETTDSGGAEKTPEETTAEDDETTTSDDSDDTTTTNDDADDETTTSEDSADTTTGASATSDESTTAEGPGFGVGLAIVALAAVGLGVRRY
ncbi:MAG: PGF-CTERM sorting domain-containing protein [Halococcoides sp.]